jgi:hypothetical protein
MLAFNAALTLTAVYLVTIEPTTRQYLAGRVDLALIEDTLSNSLVALRNIHAGSLIAQKCELYLDRLLHVLQSIRSKSSEIVSKYLQVR